VNLRPGELVFGVAPEILVDCARQLREKEEPFSLDGFSRALGAPVDEAADVLQAMVCDGFFQQAAAGTYTGTAKFNQLAASKISEGLTRSAAEALLARVVSKARHINDHPEEFQARVDCIVVFGSYLGDKPVLGDLDLGVRVSEAPRGDAGAAKLSRLRWLMTHQSPTGRVFSELRLRKPAVVSIHQLGEVLELGTPYRVVFGAPAVPAP